MKSILTEEQFKTYEEKLKELKGGKKKKADTPSQDQ